MKRLLLCRHAKSSWKEATLSDFERPLNKRGRANAPEMGRRLRSQGVRPDLVLSSPARRALETAKLLAAEFDIPGKKILVKPELYDSYPAKLLQIIRGFADDCNCVLMVGHNPEITILANILGSLELENVPTGGIVALDFAVDTWAAVDEERGRLAFFEYPRRERNGRGPADGE